MPTKKSSKKKTTARRSSSKKTSAKTTTKKRAQKVDNDLQAVASSKTPAAQKVVAQKPAAASVKTSAQSSAKIMSDIAPVTPQKSTPKKPQSLTGQAVPDNIAQHDVVPLTKTDDNAKKRRPARASSSDDTYEPLASPQPLSFQRPPEKGHHTGLWVLLLIIIIGGGLAGGWFYFQKEDAAALLNFTSGGNDTLQPTPEVQVPPVTENETTDSMVGEDDAVQDDAVVEEVAPVPVHLTLEVRNGSGIPGKAGEIGNRLDQNELFTVEKLANAKDYNYTDVILVNQTGKEIAALEAEFPNAALLISLPEGEAPSNADVVIILGK